jgi:hypothetical protein
VNGRRAWVAYIFVVGVSVGGAFVAANHTTSQVREQSIRACDRNVRDRVEIIEMSRESERLIEILRDEIGRGHTDDLLEDLDDRISARIEGIRQRIPPGRGGDPRANFDCRYAYKAAQPTDDSSGTDAAALLGGP